MALMLELALDQHLAEALSLLPVFHTLLPVFHTLLPVHVEGGTIIYLLGYKIGLPEVFWYPIFPPKKN